MQFLTAGSEYSVVCRIFVRSSGTALLPEILDDWLVELPPICETRALSSMFFGGIGAGLGQAERSGASGIRLSSSLAGSFKGSPR